jgi:hypothetical protein
MMLNVLQDTCKDILTQLFGPKSLLPDSDLVETVISRDKLYLVSILGLKTINGYINRDKPSHLHTVFHTVRAAYRAIDYSTFLRIEAMHHRDKGTKPRFDIPIESLILAIKQYNPIELRNRGRILVLEDTPTRARWREYIEIRKGQFTLEPVLFERVKVPKEVIEQTKAKLPIIAIEEDGERLVLSESATSKKWLQWTEVSGTYSYLLLEKTSP